MTRHARLAAIAIAALLIALPVALPIAIGDDDEKAPLGDPYPLPTCIVDGAKLGDGSVAADHDGRQLRFCNDDCAKKFEANAEELIEKLDAAIIADQTPLYPLKICPVTGDGLDDKGAVTDFVWRNRLVRLCCGSCSDGFEAEPKKYLIGLDRAVFEWQEFEYPLVKCVVDDGKLPGERIDVVIANRLLRVCSEACKKKLLENPIAAIARLDAAKKGGD